MRKDMRKAICVVALALLVMASFGAQADLTLNVDQVDAALVATLNGTNGRAEIDIAGAGNGIPFTTLDGIVIGGFLASAGGRVEMDLHTSDTRLRLRFRTGGGGQAADGSYVYWHWPSAEANAASITLDEVGGEEVTSSDMRYMLRSGTDWYISTPHAWPAGFNTFTVQFTDLTWAKLDDATLLTLLNTNPPVPASEMAMQSLGGLTFTALPTVNVDAAGLYVESDGLGTNDWPRVNSGVTVSAGTGGGNITTVRVENNRFDADNNDATQIDTVNINGGDTVRWTWIEGDHSVTSGDGSGDPQSGVLFDAPSTAAATVFEFTFNNAGTFNYYCIPHEGDNMFGIVVVTGSANEAPSVQPVPPIKMFPTGPLTGQKLADVDDDNTAVASLLKSVTSSDPTKLAVSADTLTAIKGPGQSVLTADLTANTIGTYTVTIEITDDDAAPLTTTKTVTVNVVEPQITSVPDLPPDGSIFVGRALKLIAPPGATYAWARQGGTLPARLQGQASGSELDFGPVQVDDSGNYEVDVAKILTPPFTVLVIDATVPLSGLAGLSLLALGCAAAGARILRRKEKK